MSAAPASAERTRWLKGMLLVGALLVTASVAVLWSRPAEAEGLRHGALMAALGLTWAAVVLAWRTLGGLQALASTARAIGRGDLSARSGRGNDPFVGGLAESLDVMAQRIGRMWADRETLLAAVSHELRSPLQRLAFGVELLADAEGDEVEGRLADVREDIADLDAMVGDLLLWARIDRQTIMRDSLSLQEALGELVAKAARLRPEVQVHLRTLPAVSIFADPRHVPRAWANLLHNAARYATSRVEVWAICRDGFVDIGVDDDGPGVPPEQAERIFEPFVRLDAARSRDAGGVGLGLALARRTAQAHEGALWVERSPLGGARFVYRQEIGGLGASSGS